MNNATVMFFLVVGGVTAALYGWDFIFTKFFVPWLAKRSIAQISNDVKEGKSTTRNEPRFVVEFDSNGLSVRSVKESTPRLTLRWSEIEKVTVFKRDLFIYDMVCMFLAKADGTGFELDEELGGWKEFIESLPTYLPECQPWENWFLEVAFPAFETKRTDIFRRNSPIPQISQNSAI